MGELGATLLVTPPGKSTLSIRIYTLMHYGAGELVACLSLALVALSLLPATVAWKLAKPRQGISS
jgi:iron(III) transport system permease protein